MAQALDFAAQARGFRFRLPVRRRLFRRLPEEAAARIEEAQRLIRAHQLSAERLAAHVSVGDFKLPILPSVEQLGDKRFDVVIVLGIEDEIVRHAELLVELLLVLQVIGRCLPYKSHSAQILNALL